MVLGSLFQNLELKLQKNEMPKRCGHFIGKKWDFLTFFFMGNEYQEMRKTQKYRVRNVQALQRRNIL